MPGWLPSSLSTPVSGWPIAGSGFLPFKHGVLVCLQNIDCCNKRFGRYYLKLPYPVEDDLAVQPYHLDRG